MTIGTAIQSLYGYSRSAVHIHSHFCLIIILAYKAEFNNPHITTETAQSNDNSWEKEYTSTSILAVYVQHHMI